MSNSKVQFARQGIAFGEVDLRWLSSSPDAFEQNPFGTCAEVLLGPLKLRLIQDRGELHVDVECAAESGSNRWLSLEILAVAADLKCVSEYVGAFRATLSESETLPECARMFPQPLKFAEEHSEALSETAQKVKVIRDAEIRIAAETGEILRKCAR